LTNDGKNPFFSSIQKLTIFFCGENFTQVAYNTTCRNFRTLAKMGLISKTDANGGT